MLSSVALMLASSAQAQNPVALIGLDGVEPAVLEAMWAAGELPNLAALAERGAYAPLRTDYQSKSPVVWTSVATGRTPTEHGIEDFVSANTGTQVPVSSTDRRVEALWNIASANDLRVLQLGWWGTWPVEEVNGVALSSRANLEETHFGWPVDTERRVYRWRRIAQQVYGDTFPGDKLAAPDDRLYTWVAVDQHERSDFDLTMVYLHRVDLASHRYYRYFQPVDGALAPETLATLEGDALTFYDAYRAVDRAVGDMVAAMDQNTNVLVVSDHGFTHMDTYHVVHFRLEAVLQHLDLWRGTPQGVDWRRTSFYVHSSPNMRAKKKVRVNLEGREAFGTVAPEEADAMVAELRETLSRVVWKHSGEPVFLFPEKLPHQDCELVVEVDTTDPGDIIELDGRRVPDAVLNIVQHSGTHNGRQPGVLIAAGPDIAQSAELENPYILDIAPTLLHALSLPVADDMTGRVMRELFTGDLATREVVRIPSWEPKGARQGDATPSDADEEMLDALRALSYID